MTQITPAVQVNEAKVWAAGDPEWWALFRSKFEPTGRITTVTTSIGGDMVLVDMDGVNHALEWMDIAQSNGVPKAAMTLRRRP